jgi:CheY-like chemotaxis protein
MGDVPRTILLLEDNCAISRLLCSVLQRQGYTVLVAFNGAEAVRIAQLHKRAVDLLLSDVVLRNETAASVVAGLRELCPEARVLFLSGFNLEDLLQRGLLDRDLMADGSAFFLQKPFSPDVLIRAVEGVLDRETFANTPHWSREEVGCSVRRSY